MNNILRQIHNIEPDKKLNKLLEELGELTKAIWKYILDPTEENMIRVIEEWIDTGSVLLQVAIVKHDIQTEEVKATADSILKQTLRVCHLMQESGVSYEVARKIVRG